MLTEYQLMHKNTPCGVLLIDSDSQMVESFANINQEIAPFLGNADTRLIRKWWEARAIPASRDSINEVLRQAGYSTTKEYLVKNLALSLTDTYWIQPVDAALTWRDVNLHRILFSGGKIPYHNQTSYDPNATLGGQMNKYWDMTATPPVLVKTAYQSYGQQAINEAFATEIHRGQKNNIPFVEYQVRKAPDNGIQSVCPAFTSGNIEFVPAMEILDSEKTANHESLYDAFISICANHGIDKDVMQDFMDYQTLTDFVISNTDEHLMNFGVLRDSDSLKLLSPAPIFDSGNSMFYADDRTVPYDRLSILERKITAFHDSEERMLSHVKNKKIVDMDCLPSVAEVERFYIKNGLPKKRATFIAGSYETKLSLLQDFQSGKKISVFQEKKKKRGK